MNRLERITAILLQLQSRKKLTAQQLADKFETSVRTIYRDIRVLEEAGVPIGAEAGLGYYLLDGYSLPPVLFTKEEGAAMLTASKLLGKLGDVSLNKQFDSAMDKIRAVLKSTEKDFLETLDNSIQVYTMRPPVDTQTFPNKFISTIQEALVKEQVIEITYYSRYANETNTRKVEPIGLCYVNGAWHLFAWCRLRGAIRDFRPDRIKSLVTLNEKYAKNKLPVLEDAVSAFFKPAQLHRITLLMKKDLTSYVGDMKYYLGLTEETDMGDRYQQVYFYPSITDFARWAISWGDKISIVEPQELLDELKEMSQALQQHYQNNGLLRLTQR